MRGLILHFIIISRLIKGTAIPVTPYTSLIVVHSLKVLWYSLSKDSEKMLNKWNTWRGTGLWRREKVVDLARREGGIGLRERGRGRERHLKREDSSHVITDSAPQPACTQIYYFSRAWKTQQIKVWSVRSPEMDIFILDFGFSFLKSAFEILSHQMVKLEYIWTFSWVFSPLKGLRV